MGMPMNGIYRLWMDEKPDLPLGDRIGHALLRFQKKTGMMANVVILPKGTEKVVVPDVEIREDASMLKWHMVIGRE